VAGEFFRGILSGLRRPQVLAATSAFAGEE
jgi:hypothetical protein